MRSFSIAVLMAVVMSGVSAMAAEESPKQRFSVSADLGYVFLSKNENKVLEDGFAMGGSVGYRILPYLEARLPILYSNHEAKDLPEGNDAHMSLLTITPGLAFSTATKLNLWFFLGAGATFVDNELTEGVLKVDEEDTAFATRLGAGLDYNVFAGLSVGIDGDVFSFSREAKELNGHKEWESTFFYAALGRLTYAF